MLHSSKDKSPTLQSQLCLLLAALFLALNSRWVPWLSVTVAIVSCHLASTVLLQLQDVHPCTGGS